MIFDNVSSSRRAFGRTLVAGAASGLLANATAGRTSPIVLAAARLALSLRRRGWTEHAGPNGSDLFRAFVHGRGSIALTFGGDPIARSTCNGVRAA